MKLTSEPINQVVFTKTDLPTGSNIFYGEPIDASSITRATFQGVVALRTAGSMSLQVEASNETSSPSHWSPVAGGGPQGLDHDYGWHGFLDYSFPPYGSKLVEMSYRWLRVVAWSNIPEPSVSGTITLTMHAQAD